MMNNNLKLLYEDLENVSAGFKYFIALDGSHVFITENASERTAVIKEEALAIQIYNKMKKEGDNVTMAEIFKVILEEDYGFKNTSFNSNSLLKLLTC